MNRNQEVNQTQYTLNYMYDTREPLIKVAVVAGMIG